MHCTPSPESWPQTSLVCVLTPSLSRGLIYGIFTDWFTWVVCSRKIGPPPCPCLKFRQYGYSLLAEWHKMWCSHLGARYEKFYAWQRFAFGWNSHMALSISISDQRAYLSSLERIKTSKFSITASRVTGWPYNTSIRDRSSGRRERSRAGRCWRFYRGQCTSHIQSRVISDDARLYGITHYSRYSLLQTTWRFRKFV